MPIQIGRAMARDLSPQLDDALQIVARGERKDQRRD